MPPHVLCFVDRTPWHVSKYPNFFLLIGHEEKWTSVFPIWPHVYLIIDLGFVFVFVLLALVLVLGYVLLLLFCF